MLCWLRIPEHAASIISIEENSMLHRFVIALAAFSGLCTGASAQSPAANWPNRTVTLVIPFTPGGSTELEFRIYLPHLAKALGQQFVMDYKPGAGTALGTHYVVKAVPDGYTILGTTSSYAAVPAAYPDLPYDPINGIAPVTQMTGKTSLIVVRSALPIRNIKELVEYARANPGKLNHVTSGTGGGPHLRAEWLYRVAKVKVNFIHYKGTAPMRIDLLAGRTDIAMTLPTLIVKSVKDGTLRAIASTGPGKLRDRLMPDVPTVAEQGYPEFGSVTWTGVFAPLNTPREIVEKLSATFAKLSKEPEITKALEPTGAIMIGSTPTDFKAFVAEEVTFIKNMIKDLGITPDL
jgi:tripartite-type tricarboxylate transporter receptor subunit TctC